jgi:hypothetical protein
MSDDERSESYCERHDVDPADLSRDFTRCPYCVEEERLAWELEHQATRDPMDEPW